MSSPVNTPPSAPTGAAPGDEAFRDTIGTLTADGKRRWIFARKPEGKWTDRRTLVSVVLLTVLFAAPFVRINGHPLLLMNILERRFVVFGQPFWPQDTFLFALLMLAGLLFIALFTVAFGRLFCGWVCPQTIFMEHVFRRIEYWIEGDAPAQKALAQSPYTSEKIRKTVLKHGIFYAISFLIGNVFLAYIIGSEAVIKLMTDPPAQHLTGLFFMLAFSAVFYVVFARLREQVCVAACPYGRLQGVLLDRESVVISYDTGRGEPRGKIRKGEERTHGDCIDCHLCVQVCPTGIDIRNGTQLECINCTACIDACNPVMKKIGKPEGLIRYASAAEIQDKRKFRFTGRMMGYTAVLTVLLAGIVVLLATRTDVETTLLRMKGTTFQKLDDGRVQNLYQLQLVNKTFDAQTLRVRIVGLDSHLTLNPGSPDGTLEVPGTNEGGVKDCMLIVSATPAALKQPHTDARLEIWRTLPNGKEERLASETLNFMAPRQ